MDLSQRLDGGAQITMSLNHTSRRQLNVKKTKKNNYFGFLNLDNKSLA